MAGTDLPIQPLMQECSECKTSFKRYTHNQSRFFGCSVCGCWFHIKPDGTLTRDRKVMKKTIIRKDPFQPGRPITFGEVKYIMISRAEKADKSAMQYKWREYGLFHPLHGYAWLSEYDGHWVLLKETIISPKKNSSTEVVFDAKPFHLFQKYKSATTSAAGEFHSNVLNESVSYFEYIAPPFLLSCESGKSYTKWFYGESLFPEDVAKAAGINKSELPSPSGVGAVQVSKSNFSHRSLVILSAIAIGLLIAIHLGTIANMEEREVVAMNETISDSLMGTTLASPSFVLPDKNANLEFSYYSNVSNNWAEAEILLVNDNTNEMRGLSLGAEYYSGYDDEGSWSEGDLNTNKLLSSVGPGTYHLNVKQTKGGNGGGNNFSLNVRYDVPIDSNFYIMLLIMTLFPAISWLRQRQFEKSRWMNSDYSPFNTWEDE